MKLSLKTFFANRWLVFAVRVALGGCFFAASLSKLQNPDYFVATVISYGVLPESLARIYAVVLPWAELTAGCALILGIFPVYASWLSILLAFSFAVAGIHSLVYSRQADCGCFGQYFQLSPPVALGIDVILIILSVELLFHQAKTGFLSIGDLLHRLSTPSGKYRLIFEPSSKLAVLVLVVLLTAFLIPANNTGSPIDKDIDAVLNTSKYALLYFYAEGCPACEAFKPALRELESDYSSSITVLRIDYNESPYDVRRFAVVKTPTVIIITGRNSQGGYVVYQRFEGQIDGVDLRNSLSAISHR
jgi:thiol-disulfide isomerase/thioredoxin/uncharacterized membrane protein YphA (DoxX/SURF4 family)